MTRRSPGSATSLALTVLFLWFGSAGCAAAQPKPMSLVDLPNVAQLTDPQLSPDGRYAPLKYVANVKTPAIFLVGERDVRVPMPPSVEMYRALKSNGVPTRLYVAPREPHGGQELRRALFKMNAELEWFEKHTRGAGGTK